MYARITARVRVQHSLGIICPRTKLPILRHVSSLQPSGRPLELLTLNLLSDPSAGRAPYGTWVEVKGEMEEGTRGAMVDIAANHFVTLEGGQDEDSEIELVGRVHSKYHGFDECVIVEVRGQRHGQRFYGIPVSYITRLFYRDLEVGSTIKVFGAPADIQLRTDDSGILLYIKPSSLPTVSDSPRSTPSDGLPLHANQPGSLDPSSSEIELLEAARYVSPSSVSTEQPRLEHLADPYVPIVLRKPNPHSSSDEVTSSEADPIPSSPTTPPARNTRSSTVRVALPTPPQTPSTSLNSRLKKSLRPTRPYSRPNLTRASDDEELPVPGPSSVALPAKKLLPKRAKRQEPRTLLPSPSISPVTPTLTPVSSGKRRGISEPESPLSRTKRSRH